MTPVSFQGERYTNLHTICVGLTPRHRAAFDIIKEYYGMHTDASVLRFLIVQQARALERMEGQLEEEAT